MKYEQLILDHYQKVAKHNGLRPSSSMDDLFVRESETNFILEEIGRFIREEKKHPVILDVGFGNAYLLSVIRENFPELELHGIEFTPELFELAKARNISNCEIICGDIKKMESFKKQVDIVITERVIINILNRKDQYKALRNIFSMLNMGGHYIMVESFSEPLALLDSARREMCLANVEQSYQNKYLNECVVKNLQKYGMIELKSTIPATFLSTHFYITRVFHKAIRPQGGKVKFSKFSQFFRQALPPAIGNYSPILFRVFKKIKQTNNEVLN
ncbi:MAG: class I SAM-dependent methyltransferase [Bacteriovoracaceae bacterium]|nr:class I SAM-dependent methyltransferase [Bacteriovoracaceae bacterium]